MNRLVSGSMIALVAYLGYASLSASKHSSGPSEATDESEASSPSSHAPQIAPPAIISSTLDDFFAAPKREIAGVPRGFRIIALSTLAESLTMQPVSGDRATRATRLVELALSPRVRPYRSTIHQARLGAHGLYLAHLNIVLGVYELLAQDGRYKRLHTRATRHLLSISNNPLAHAPSYPNEKARWPADQSALLFSVWLYDRAHGTTLAHEPVRRWLDVMQNHTAADYGHLPASELSGTKADAALPRGCAMSFTTHYAAAFAPDYARDLWRRYRREFMVDFFGLAGLREWPRGIERKADIDSGPIVRGIGAAATGLGLGAAGDVGDKARQARMIRTMNLVHEMNRSAMEVGRSLLARAIAYRGVYAAGWWKE
ncbi:MAG: hypothetical protein AAFP04_06510 [Myxococcota bacterium]